MLIRTGFLFVLTSPLRCLLQDYPGIIRCHHPVIIQIHIHVFGPEPHVNVEDTKGITQVSRMDRWKDPEGLLDVFELVRQQVACRLLYCYSSSVDDPEGAEVLDTVRRKAENSRYSADVLFIEGSNQVLVNAIQRFSTVVMQKSIKEGFCLCVTEALWKGRPVVGTNVGGIPIQLKDGVNGFVVEPHDARDFADKVVQLLQNPELAASMGHTGKETVRRHFLITRLIADRLNMYNSLWCRTN
jgi:trehalose synthase